MDIECKASQFSDLSGLGRKANKFFAFAQGKHMKYLMQTLNHFYNFIKVLACY